MKIGIIVQNMRIGGVRRLIADEMHELTARGHRVVLIYFEKDENAALVEDGLNREDCIHLPYPRMRGMRSLINLIVLLKKVRPDVVYTHMWFANTVGRVAAYLARVSKIFAFEHSIYDSVKPNRQFFIDRLLQRLSSAVIAVSEAVKDSLIAHGIDPARIEVIRNGVSLQRYATSASREVLRSQMNLPQHAFVFVFIGRLIKDKAVDLMLRAVARVPAVHASIVGIGPEEAALRSLAKELSIEERIHFLGARNDIPEVLKTSDALVLPSKREGFGIVAIEARAAGLPVILSDFGEATNLVSSGEQGYIIKSGNVEELTEAMTRLVEEPGIFQKFKAAATKGLTTYSIERHVSDLEALNEKYA